MANTTVQKELNTAVFNFKVALTRAGVCGYVSTVREQREQEIARRWDELMRKNRLVK